ncbi:MAG: DUF58 domain-containing protein [Microbacterium sp.]|uniref:DUF58 domain-containing protein n=1 Tax=Microbacterium sp. TaxID=51671 RepID=UPI0039E270E8
MSRLWPLTLRGTGALALAAACFVFAAQLGIDELVYFGLLLLGVLAASLASLYLTRRADSVSRTVSSELAVVGRTSTVDVRVGVRTVLPTPPGRWSDTLPSTLAGDPVGVFPALESGLRGDERTVRLSYPVTGAHRGVAPIGPLRITTTDPFGLARRSHVLRAGTPVTVTPPLVDLPALSGHAGATGGILQATTEQLGQGSDNLIARRYMPGDSMRRIHWRATAHRDELMVRQEEQESTPEATVVFARGVARYSADAAREPGADAAFEAAVTVCVSAAVSLAREGYTVEVIDADGTPLIDPLDSAGAGEARELAAMLIAFSSVVARPDDHLGELAALFTGVTTGPVVVVAGRFDPADARAIAPIAHHSSLPALFAVAPQGDALDRAADAGWRCGAFDPDADLVAAWSAIADRGASRVG